jgi:hypothetical protein
MLGVSSSGWGRNARVRNGSIALEGDQSVGVSMLYAGAQGMPSGLYPSLPQFEDAAAPPSGSWGNTGNVVERLSIRTGGRGVVLGGDNNVVRDSTIEVDGPVNRIVYKGWGNAGMAVNLLDSENVWIENNVLESIAEVVRQVGRTSVQEQGTQRR